MLITTLFQFFLLSFLLIVLSLITAGLLKKNIFKDYPLPIIGLLVLGLVICVFHIVDRLAISSAYTLLTLILVFSSLFSVALYRIFRVRDSICEVFKEICPLVISWILAFWIIAIPIFTIFPRDTYVTAYGVCHDSIHHAFMIKGYEYTKSKKLDKGLEYELDNYPRASHSFAFAFNQILKVDPGFLLLPISIFFLSLCIFSASSYLWSTAYTKNILWVLAVTSASCYCLGTTSTYLIFLAQIASMPFILGLVYLMTNFSLRNFLAPQISMLLSFLFITISLYSIFPFLALSGALLLLIYFVSYDFFTFRKIELGIENKKYIFSYLLVFLLTALAAYKSFYKYAFSLMYPDPGSEDLLASKGVFPELLSPFHLTGTWIAETDIRTSFHYQNYVHLFILLIIVYSIVISLTHRLQALNKAIIALAIPTFILPFITDGTYVHFKLITIMASLTFFGFTSAIYVLFYRKSFILKSFGAVMLMTILYFSSIHTFSGLPGRVLDEDDYHNFNLLKTQVVDKGRTLFVSKEDMIQNFIDSNDDWIPYTQYLRRHYIGRDYHYIVVDSKATEEMKDFKLQRPKRFSQINSAHKDCIQQIGRFNIYDLKCIQNK